MAERVASLLKFADPDRTADGSARASIPFVGLRTLWINTGTLCNIECAHCYIESSPSNDRLAHFTLAEFLPFLAEAKAMGASEIGFTGGEPFLNKDLLAMAGEALDAGLDVLILTNAMRPMMRPRTQATLLELLRAHGRRLKLRVSIDHYTEERHDAERGAQGFAETLKGFLWLIDNGFCVSVAGRKLWDETEAAREGYRSLFRRLGAGLNADDPAELVLFPEMDAAKDTPEITAACWGILNKTPESVMCATSRMVVKRRSADPTVLACTLIPYDESFEMGANLAAATHAVKLNHPHCSRFCVLGGASCSPSA